MTTTAHRAAGPRERYPFVRANDTPDWNNASHDALLGDDRGLGRGVVYGITWMNYSLAVSRKELSAIGAFKDPSSPPVLT